nr:hypothetical protein [Nitrospira sp.]
VRSATFQGDDRMNTATSGARGTIRMNPRRPLGMDAFRFISSTRYLDAILVAFHDSETAEQAPATIQTNSCPRD